MNVYNSSEFRFSSLMTAWRSCFFSDHSMSGIDELPQLIEVFFRTVAKVSIAQHLQSGAPNPALNQYACWALSHEKESRVQVGTWVKIIREVVFSLRNDLSSAKKRGLALQELTWDAKMESDTDRLVAFRSSFAHGAMIFPPQSEVDELRGILNKMIFSFPFLHAEMTESPRGHPVLVTANGSLPLYPLFELNHGSAVERKLSMSDDARLGEMWHRYEAELEGEFTEHIAELRTTFPRSQKYIVVADVRKSLLQDMNDGRHILQVIGRPQTGKSALVANINAYVPGAVGIRVEQGMLTQSTISMSKFLLRRLGEPAKAKETAEDKLVTAVARAAAKEGSPVIVALDDAHLGLVAHPGSRMSLAQAIRIWMPQNGRHTRLTLVLVSAKGQHIGLPGVMIHQLADTASYLMRSKGFARTVIREACTRSERAKQVLGILKKADDLTVVEIANRLERGSRTRVFTPEVEHCVRCTLVDIVDDKNGKYALWPCLRTPGKTCALPERGGL